MVFTLNKGGILTYRWPDAVYSDFGWVVENGRECWITHWWSERWEGSRKGTQAVVEGPVFAHRETVSTPLQHFVLRLLSRVVGRRLIALLKDRLIFRKRAGKVRFRRQVTWGGNRLEIVDTFRGLPATALLLPAPRSSKRYVASADSYHVEDLCPSRGVRVQRVFDESTGHRIVTTTIVRETSP